MLQQLIPSLRFPIFKKEDYSSIKFGSVVKDSGYGPRFNGNDYDVFGNVKTIRGTDVSLEGEILYDQVPIAKLDESFIKNHILKDGDLVMITTADCGLTGIFREQEIKYIPSAYAVKISLKDKASPVYFKYFFQTSIAKNQINRFVRKATVANLPGSDIPKLNINLPSIQEQQKIASFLSDVDTKITKLTKKKTLLEQYKKGIMQKIFNQELRFKDDNGNDFPDWKKKKLGELSNITTGSSNRQDSGLDGEFTFFDRSEDIRTSSRYLFDGEAIIVAGEGSNFIPKYYIGKFDLHQRTYAIMSFKEAVSKYVFYYMHYHRSYFLSQAVGSTVKSLRLPMFQKMPIKLPLIEEQTKIANFLSDIDLKIETLNTKIENTKVFKKGLLQQMFI